MSATSPERQHGLDHRFFHLVRWELRPVRGRRRIAWGIVLLLLGAGITAAARRANLSELPTTLDLATVVLLIATPYRNPVADMAQLTFGYSLLRLAIYVLMALGKLLLPAAAAGSVGNDRQAGRLQDLQMMPFSPAALYLAKVVTAALPYACLGALLLGADTGVLAAEYVPVSEIMRLGFEGAGQIVMMACVAVTCSAVFASPWAARITAYAVLWLVLPLLWLAVLWATGAVPAGQVAALIGTIESRAPIDFTKIAVLQGVFTLAVCLLAFFLGVRALRAYGETGRVGRRASRRLK